MSDVTDDDLTRWERLCHETYRTGAEREYRDLGAEAMRFTPRLIAEIRRLRSELSTQNSELSARVAELTAENAELRAVNEKLDTDIGWLKHDIK